MSFQVAGAEKKCATCRHWSGTRQVVLNGRAIDVESPSARATCNERTRNGVAVTATQSCSKHDRWSLIRV